MQAVVCDRYGAPDVLHLAQVARPSPKPNEILIRIHATTVTSGDCRVRGLRVPLGFALASRFVLGFGKPRQPILGSEFAGVVEAVGSEVSRFRIGNAVFGIDGGRMGCHAQYKCMPQDGAVAMKPANLTLEEAAALPFGGTTALDYFRRARLQCAQRVLVNGASGSVGTAAVQLAVHFGAEVTAVCSAANADLVRSLGAAHVIDYTQEDFTRNGRTYDVIVDAVGTAPYSRSRSSLTETGRLLLVAASLPQMLPLPWVAATSRRRIIAGPAVERAEDLRSLAELAEAGEYLPVIDRRYPLAQMVEAHRYVETGHKRGSVVVTLPVA